MAEHIEIDDVALSINVGDAELSAGSAGCRKDGCPEIFRIALPDSNRCKHTCLIAATRVRGVEAVLQQLSNINNGVLAIG